MHPEVIKYIKQNTSKAGKARWANIPPEDRRKHLTKAHEGLKKYWENKKK